MGITVTISASATGDATQATDEASMVTTIKSFCETWEAYLTAASMTTDTQGSFSWSALDPT